jgi:hypothetical protein
VTHDFLAKWRKRRAGGLDSGTRGRACHCAFNARLGVLTLAFDHLGADAALTEAFQDNAASQRVSRRLGYEPDGISRDTRGAEVLVSDRLRLRRSVWLRLNHPRAQVDGMDACAAMFDVSERSAEV